MAEAAGCVQWKELLVPAVCQAPSRCVRLSWGTRGGRMLNRTWPSSKPFREDAGGERVLHTQNAQSAGWGGQEECKVKGAWASTLGPRAPILGQGNCWNRLPGPPSHLLCCSLSLGVRARVYRRVHGLHVHV